MAWISFSRKSLVPLKDSFDQIRPTKANFCLKLNQLGNLLTFFLFFVETLALICVRVRLLIAYTINIIVFEWSHINLWEVCLGLHLKKKLFFNLVDKVISLLFFIFIFTLFCFTILYLSCHTLTWICHRCTWVPNPEPPSHLPPPIISLDHPHAPAPGLLYPVSNID